MKTLLMGVLLAVSPALAFAHPGGLDKNGGHTNKKTGEYHYHKKKSAEGDEGEPAEAPAKKQPAKKKAAVEGADDEGAVAEKAPKKKKRKSGGKKKDLETADTGDLDLTE